MASIDALDQDYDLVIVGSGAGGGTLAYALRNTQYRVLLLEQGGFLPQEPQNWDKREVFKSRRYYPANQWWDLLNNKPLEPTQVYYVGGKTKLYGAALLRMRERDFAPVEHKGGLSPGWPISYQDLEPWYGEAERVYRVHGSQGVDPTEPPRSYDYPYPELPADEYMKSLRNRLGAQGVVPASIPIGIDYREGGACIYCRTCDGYPCNLQAKSDADTCCVRPATEAENITLVVNAKAVRLLMDQEDKIKSLEVMHNGKLRKVNSKLFVLSCGAIESPALLLSSKNKFFPNGIANSSGLIGRNLMFRNKSLMFAMRFLEKPPTEFQKLYMVMNYYFGDNDWGAPLGSLQALGSFPLEYFAPAAIGRFIREHSVGFFAMSEDLPLTENRVEIMVSGAIGIRYQSNNMDAHKQLVKRFKKILRRSGYTYVLTAKGELPRYSGGHECGTLRFGTDPKESVLDPYCRTHDVDNLFVVDGSFFPSSSAVNPALTIMAQSLRVGDHLSKRLG